MGDDAMAIRTTHNALLYFFLCLADALGTADHHMFFPANVVEIQSDGVLSIAAVYAAMLQFVGIDKHLNAKARVSVIFAVTFWIKGAEFPHRLTLPNQLFVFMVFRPLAAVFPHFLGITRKVSLYTLIVFMPILADLFRVFFTPLVNVSELFRFCFHGRGATIPCL